MMDSNQNKSFQYTYSASEQEEVRRIRSKYIPKEEDKLEQLQRLDASVTQKATVYSLGAGVIGTLIFGAGMSACLVLGGGWLVPGVIVGALGLAMLGLAYPLYALVLKKERERVAPEILRLTDELLK